MKYFLAVSLILALTTVAVGAQDPSGLIDKEVRRIDLLAANPDGKLAVVAAMAGPARNFTGQWIGRI